MVYHISISAIKFWILLSQEGKTYKFPSDNSKDPIFLTFMFQMIKYKAIYNVKLFVLLKFSSYE